MLSAMDPKIKLLLTPGVQDLIADLDLVVGHQPGACPRFHNLDPFDLTPAQRHQQLCKDLYLRNRKFSHHVYPSYTNFANKRARSEQELSGTLW